MNPYEKPFREIFAYLAKRVVMLFAKLCGFKSFCMLLSTVLLAAGIISEDAWLTITITVICAAGGLRLADTYSAVNRFRRRKQRSASHRSASYRGTEPFEQEQEEYQNEENYDETEYRSGVSGDTADTAAAGIRRAAENGKQRIRTLLAGAAESRTDSTYGTAAAAEPDGQNTADPSDTGTAHGN